MITKKYLKECIIYDPGDGSFLWKERPERHFCSNREFRRWNSRYSGKPAGCVNGAGYLHIWIKSNHYKAHRLAWLYIHGYFPPEQIDHKSGIRDDNRMLNLRLADDAENSKNRKKRSDNVSGMTGVGWNKASSKWRVRINSGRKTLNLGLFSTYEEACSARQQAEIDHGYHENHGREVRS